MYISKIYSASKEYIISHSSPNRTFDIELQHPQPRRRQIIDPYHQTHEEMNPYIAQAYSISKSKQNENHAFEFDQRSLDNNLVNIPSNPLFIPDPTPEIIEERYAYFANPSQYQ